MRYDGGIIVPQGAHGANLWHMCPSDEEVQQGRVREYHLCGVFTQGVAEGEVSGARVFGGSSSCGMTPRALHVPPLSVQGGGGSRGGGTSALP